MNMHSMYDQETQWEPVTQIVFYEPRTIPHAWDMSEYMPELDEAVREFRLSKDDQNHT